MTDTPPNDEGNDDGSENGEGNEESNDYEISLDPDEIDSLSQDICSIGSYDPAEFDVDHEHAREYLAFRGPSVEDSTLKVNHSHLREFVDAMTHGMGVDPLAASIDDLRKYFRFCAAERRNREKTVKNKRASIKKFYEYIEVHAEVESELSGTKVDAALTDNILRLCPDPLERSSITRDELQDLYDATVKPLHELLCRFLYETGGRVSDIAKLKIGNIDLENESVEFPDSKGGKRYVIPIREELILRTEEYLSYKGRSLEEASSEEFLFPSRYGGHLDDQTIRDYVTKTAGLAGIQDTLGEIHNPQIWGDSDTTEMRRVTPHTLRHSFLTHLKEDDLPDELLAFVAGHEDPSTTKKHYVDGEYITKEMLEEVRDAPGFFD